MAGVNKRAADKARGKAGRWRGWYMDRHGRQRFFTGTTDKAATLEMAREKERREAMVREGTLDPAALAHRQAAERPIAEHLAEWRQALADRGATPKHAAGEHRQAAAVIHAAGIRATDQLSADRVAPALARLRREKGWGARTHNAHLASVKAFCRWLDEAERIPAVPKGIRALAKLNEQADRRYVRRTPSPDEFTRLMAAANAGPTITRRRANQHGPVTATLTGPDRELLYRTAAWTGLRVNELRTLTVGSFDLGDRPAVRVEARNAKARRQATIPIPRALAERLRAYLAGRPPGEPAWPLIPAKPAREMLHPDCVAAGIPPVDPDGRRLDMHSLRRLLAANLAARGVPPKVIQKFMRHSTITLTFDTYMDADADELRRAVDDIEED